MTRVGILGGTFDPPHLGHLKVARSVIDQGLVDTVWFLPCWKHAFGKEPTPFYHRAAMCYLLVRHISDMYVCMAESEIKSTYSVEILKYLKAGNPENEFQLVLGADNYWKIDKWKEKDTVLKLAPPIWVQRPEVKNPPGPLVECFHEASSTTLRPMIRWKADRNRLEELTSSEVIDYAWEHQLYQSA